MLLISSTKPNCLENHIEFSSNITVMYYLYTQPPFGNPRASYYVCCRKDDDILGLYNKSHQFLYDVTNIDVGRVAAMIEERSFVNHRIHDNLKPLPTNKTINVGESWSQECRRLCAGSIVLYLTKYHPNRTYKECEFVMKNEGYRINEEGFLEPIEEFKQL